MASTSILELATKGSREDDTLTLAGNKTETRINTPTADMKIPFWKDFQVDSCDTIAIFESWEIIFVRPTVELTTFKRMLGMNIVSTYKILKDGYTGVRSIPSHTQAELANAVASAENEWVSQKLGLFRLMKQESYHQNLARRIFELPACLPSKLGALLDCRFVATNKNPHIRREWKVVMLKPISEVMTDEGLKSDKLGPWIKGGRGQSEPVQKWLVILRGQDTRVSKKGFRTFNTMSNPWARVDGEIRSEKGTPQATRGQVVGGSGHNAGFEVQF
ncbi:hypothetical protein F4678DRAFT_442575 [Xylaria arbuscula]|nr:hypothetical protein F4678DRAFT_442575 [Xylaria arbuscula]